MQGQKNVMQHRPQPACVKRGTCVCKTRERGTHKQEFDTYCAGVLYCWLTSRLSAAIAEAMLPASRQGHGHDYHLLLGVCSWVGGSRRVRGRHQSTRHIRPWGIHANRWWSIGARRRRRICTRRWWGIVAMRRRRIGARRWWGIGAWRGRQRHRRGQFSSHDCYVFEGGDANGMPVK